MLFFSHKHTVLQVDVDALFMEDICALQHTGNDSERLTVLRYKMMSIVMRLKTSTQVAKMFLSIPSSGGNRTIIECLINHV
jgi:hypothetical protein